MRYIKPFNESLQPDEFQELKDFCETLLINLIDRDTTNDYFKLEYTGIGGKRLDTSTTSNYVRIELYGPLNDNGERLSTWCWNDVKDYYIPFLQLLKTRYKLATRVGVYSDYNYVDFRFRTSSRYKMYDKFFKIEDVINDRIELDKSNLFSISVQISSKL